MLKPVPAGGTFPSDKSVSSFRRQCAASSICAQNASNRGSTPVSAAAAGASVPKSPCPETTPASSPPGAAGPGSCLGSSTDFRSDPHREHTHPCRFQRQALHNVPPVPLRAPLPQHTPAAQTEAAGPPHPRAAYRHEASCTRCPPSLPGIFETLRRLCLNTRWETAAGARPNPLGTCRLQE